ncbi:MAG TPA: hypothetical protein VFQ83_07200 [Candidatus Udaeobacter sp.]|jgi:hypothetical protein|nr:hypothetical protein [Candidatus Udaeobacter sp.]
MPISAVFGVQFNLHTYFKAPTGIIISFQLAIATSTDAEKLMEYAEDL